MTTATQISANISEETRDLLKRYVAANGVNESHLIETALQHHLSALEAIPADLVIPPVIHVAPETGNKILDRIENPASPTAAMQELFDD